jgi:hydrogenase expression/formation protein HypC
MRIIEAGEFSALCQGDTGRVQVDLSLVGPQPAGTWLLVFLNAAREVLSSDDAAKIQSAHQALKDIMNGLETDIATHFPDLVDRDPELPPSLLTLTGTDQ